jgi:hypothetical protein
MAEANTREQMLWGQLIAAVFVLLVVLIRMGFVPTDPKRVEGAYHLAFSFYMFSIVVEAIRSMYFVTPDIEDERDRTIKLKGTSSAHTILVLGVVYIIAESASKDSHLSVACLAGWLFYLLLLSLIVGHIRQIRLYHFHERWIPNSWGRGRRRRRLERMKERLQQKGWTDGTPEA